ncbi:MAG: alanine--tRNA ligase-related protein, partial [bacterium]|nr:alanine--tRNA ligase-related protein [bacterium]
MNTPWTAQRVRETYLRFFKERGHAVIPSAPLVPENDPSTLFTGSGMQPIVPYLLGEPHPQGTRLVDSQKCFRSQDIDEVGDNRHTTFFEMLGNWSLGDYFKREQVGWMYEFLTKDLGLDPAKLFVTVFRGSTELGIPRDEETVGYWREHFAADGVDAMAVDFSERDGMQDGRIFFYDERKNWWSRSGVPSAMPVGEPGGPDSEVFWDFGATRGLHEASLFVNEPCHVNCDCGRFLEIGNNVFMQFRKTETGFEPLPKQNVDFGGGLERMAAAVADDPDVFRIDLFTSARTELERLSGTRYGDGDEHTKAFRVILDHLRAAVFLIGDGVLPSNKDQGYFVRRLIRRAVRFGRVLGIEDAFTVRVADAVITTYAGAYPDIHRRADAIRTELSREEEKFQATLARGEAELEKMFTKRGQVNGDDAFVLYATYGFPLELTQEIAGEKGQRVDKERFESEFRKHQELSRAGSEQKFAGGLADH